MLPFIYYFYFLKCFLHLILHRFHVSKLRVYTLRKNTWDHMNMLKMFLNYMASICRTDDSCVNFMVLPIKWCQFPHVKLKRFIFFCKFALYPWSLLHCWLSAASFVVFCWFSSCVYLSFYHTYKCSTSLFFVKMKCEPSFTSLPPVWYPIFVSILMPPSTLNQIKNKSPFFSVQEEKYQKHLILIPTLNSISLWIF